MSIEVLAWRRGYRGKCKVTVEDADAEIRKLEKRNKAEKVLPSVLVAAAESKRNKLHQLLEWDDTVCGVEHRLAQARLILRSVMLYRDDLPGQEIRKYETVRTPGVKKETAYKRTELIMQDPEDRAALLQRALGELVALRRRYSALQELAIVFRSVDEVLETVKL